MTELTPPHLREQFGRYVETAVQTELSRIDEYYFGAPGQGFWVAETERVIGMVGVERRSHSQAELRRMAVDAAFRRRGIARRLLEVALKFRGGAALNIVWPDCTAPWRCTEGTVHAQVV